MALPAQSYPVWKAIVTLTHVLAISFTLVRLTHRYRTRRLWWDDYVAVVPLLADVLFCIVFWFSYRHRMATTDFVPSATPLYTYWIFAIFPYITVLWSSRISLMLSIARIFPPGETPRRIALGLTFTFGMTYLGCLLTMVLICKPTPAKWYIIDENKCVRSASGHFLGGIITVAADFASDLLLTLFPLILFWRVQLPLNQRRLVLSAFSASSFTLLAATVYCVVWFGDFDLGPDARLLQVVSANLEAAVSLIACNLLVVTTYFYRVFRRIDNIESYEYDTSSPKSEPVNSRSCTSRSFPHQPREMHTSEISNLTFTEITESGYEWSTRGALDGSH
ncbi:hypothetical protein BDQ12DRAFT_673952 [Crucibulum laeve]|uniref:Rhodopsin domain-containing protein n=1 Tax=Crucibulum laeve TaxID=68775 RepID=A0A5C3MHV0_9AGAR|nr:hypothetical protein BDQ12DRAFT_673952 [Crucibulum laeve]